MKRQAMNLSFNILATSEQPQSVVINRIVFELERNNYIIERLINNKIFFKDDIWRIRPRSIFFKNADKGVFEVTSTDYGVTISYTYYISFFIEAISLVILFLLMFVTSPFILLIGFGLLGQLSVRIYTLGGEAKQLINDITKARE